MENSNNPWKIINKREIYNNPWIQLTEFDVINPNGGEGIYGKVHFKNRAIGILALDASENVILVGQYRFTIDAYTWELPEGGGELHEAPLETAKRELLEETGLKAAYWEELLTIHTSNSVTDEYGVVFIARELSQHQSDLDDTEDIKVKKIPFTELLEQVMRNEITDSLTIAAVLKYQVLKMR